MRKITAILVIFCLIFSLVQVTFAEENADRQCLYVSVGGNDNGDGSVNQPFKTIIAARDKIRELKKTGISPKNGFVVYLREGNHSLKESLVLTEEDSGTETAPIVYRAFPGETVSIVGGASLPGDKFEKVTDSAILNRVITESARSQIFSVNLKEMGFTEFGETYWPGAYSYTMKGLKKPKVASPELFVNGKIQTVARYPNEGFMTVSEVVDPGAYPRMWEPDMSERSEYVKEDKRD